MTNDANKRAYRAALLKRCGRLSGHGPKSPADVFEQLAVWCREHEVGFDSYGQGELIQGFEEKIRTLLGFEASRFLPSGTMAQPIALKIWSGRQKLNHVGMHPTAHMELHEQKGYAHLYGLRATLVGPRQSPLLAEHLDAIKEPISALLIELPIREAGGQLPLWSQLEELKASARERGIRLHLDGARLWECAAFYERSYAEICEGFDSCYVSFYKGIGALAGSMLLGPEDFIAEATLWQRRAGGNLCTMVSNVASAAMRFDEQIARMPLYYKRTLSMAAVLNDIEGIQVLPQPPHVNMMHLFLPFEPEVIADARDLAAEETGLFILSNARPADVPGFSRSEFYVGDAAMKHGDDEVRAAFVRFMEIAGTM